MELGSRSWLYAACIYQANVYSQWKIETHEPSTFSAFIMVYTQIFTFTNWFSVTLAEHSFLLCRDVIPTFQSFCDCVGDEEMSQVHYGFKFSLYFVSGSSEIMCSL